jgi:hypothetical protein
MGIQALEQCEQTLRQALAQAAAAGDYDGVRQIMLWAENLKAMIAAAKSNRGADAAGGVGSPPRKPAPGNANLPIGPSAGTPGPRPARRMAQDEYPRFARRNDEIVKIGWSKSEKKEYHHRAPKRALDTLLAAIKRLGTDGSGFSSENLNPLKDSETGGVFPTYQVFVALALLRKLDLVKQHGRKGGYSLLRDKPLDATVAAAWEELPAWRG